MSKIGLLVLIESVDVNLSNSIGNDFFPAPYVVGFSDFTVVRSQD